MALILGTGFLGLLRVYEFRALRACDFLTPTRLLATGGPMFVTIRLPKMRRLTARRAYTWIDDQGFIAYVEAVIARLPPEAPIFPGSYAQLRTIFNMLCGRLGVPAGRSGALSLGSLRPGGATYAPPHRQPGTSQVPGSVGQCPDAGNLHPGSWGCKSAPRTVSPDPRDHQFSRGRRSGHFGLRRC